MLLTSWRLTKMQVWKDFLGCPAYVVPFRISVLVIDETTLQNDDVLYS